MNKTGHLKPNIKLKTGFGLKWSVMVPLSKFWIQLLSLMIPSASRKKVLSALQRAKRSFEIIKVKGFFLISPQVISENWDCNRFQIKSWIFLWMQNENCQK